MDFKVTFRGINSTEHIKEYLEKRIESLNRYLINPLSMHFVIQKNSEGFTVEGNIVCKDFDVYAREKDKDVFTAIDYFKDNIKKQLKKKREKIVDKKAKPKLNFTESKVKLRDLIMVEAFEGKPMSREEALLQLKTMKLPFLVFKDAETGYFAVMYKKESRTYSIILLKEE